MLENSQNMGKFEFCTLIKIRIYEYVDQRLNKELVELYSSDITAITNFWSRCPFATSAESVIRF